MEDFPRGGSGSDHANAIISKQKGLKNGPSLALELHFRPPNWHSKGHSRIGMVCKRDRVTNIQLPHLLHRIYQAGRFQL